jgi:hypothetical protein
MKMTFTIKDFRPHNQNTLMGFFNLQAGPLTIRGMTLHEKNGNRWVNFPAKPFSDSDGNEAWYPIVKIEDKERFAKFQQWALAELEKILPVEPEPEPQYQEPADAPF